MIMEILFTREFWEEREDHRRKITQTLQEFIRDPNRGRLVQLVGEIWALRFTYKDLEWYINERVLKYSNLENLAEAFGVLIDESLPLSERLKIKIPGFGSGAVSEILFSINPNKFPVYNRKFVIGAMKLGYKIGSLEHVIRLTPDTLNELVRIHEQILTDFLDLRDEIIQRTGIDVPKFDFTDGMLWKVAQDEIQVKELLEWKQPKKLMALGEVEIVLKALGKGVSKYVELVNEGEHEGTALEKAAFYTEGILEAYGVNPGDVSDLLRSLNELLTMLLQK
ncbi:hypothetical protein E3E38_03390 [Thermococcus sp. 18S1]|uniref:hypothetical protein n=1 Tax=Thermococcus sp. 18S1 TaxID=1638210 RepID=UPI00143C6C7A|nr:hypothetical protein [Thermococcus sp. 18S1]NJE30093.1 hypothetical protein [Thermococcus sp. 18S1]